MIKITLLLSVAFSFAISNAEIVEGDVLESANGDFFYYGDIDSEEKIQEFAKECESVEQRLPTVSDIMKLKFPQFSPKTIEINTTAPSIWNLWKSPGSAEEQVNNFIKGQADHHWNISGYSDNGTANYIYTPAKRFDSPENRLREEYNENFWSLYKTYSISNEEVPDNYIGPVDRNIPDVYLTSSRFLGREGSFIALAPPSEAVSNPLVVGLSTDLVRDPSKGPANAMYIEYPSVFPIGSLEPNRKMSWHNPRPRSGHVDKINEPQLRRIYKGRIGSILKNNPNLRVSVQCVHDQN